MENPGYQYDLANTRIVIEGTNQPVALCVAPEHGLLLSTSHTSKYVLEKLEVMLGHEDTPHADRVATARQLIGLFLTSFQREQIRMLPETA